MARPKKEVNALEVKKDKPLDSSTGYVKDSKGEKHLVVSNIEDKLTKQVHSIRRDLALREMISELRGLQNPQVHAILEEYKISFIDYVKDGVFFPSWGIEYPEEKREIIQL